MKITLIIISVIIVLLLIAYFYYGGFNKIAVEVSKQGGETVVYEKITGDYKQSGSISNKIYYSLLNDEHIETFKGFGIFYDNPQNTEKSKLRSEAGCVIEQVDTARLAKLSGKYQIKTIPEKEYITAEFPFNGKFSVLMGIMKVYPALEQFAKENGYAEGSTVMEIYDIPNKKIYYRKELTAGTDTEDSL